MRMEAEQRWCSVATDRAYGKSLVQTHTNRFEFQACFNYIRMCMYNCLFVNTTTSFMFTILSYFCSLHLARGKLIRPTCLTVKVLYYLCKLKDFHSRTHTIKRRSVKKKLEAPAFFSRIPLIWCVISFT